ncbi:MAG TPA: hypothetical protein VJ875_11980 [Pyrinomonadaceae bacterium]|nr:hypothetical protein [Pyrinomonadaceae bacterium]
MQGLSATEILEVWEAGLSQNPAERALELLSVCVPKTTRADLERMNIGKRDALLLTFRERVFGPHFSGVTRCPNCNASLEMAFCSSDVRASFSSESADPFSFSFGDYEFECRLPNSADLLAVIGARDPDLVANALFDRCVLEKWHRGAEVSTANLPAEAIDAIVDEMGRRDPQADIRFALACPDCSHEWEAIFDIVSFAWNEISAWAGRLLRQVHTLAMAYGWREVDILSMNSLRRQVYLEMLGE